MVGAKLIIGDREAVVLFRRSGRTGGHVTVKEQAAEKTLIDKDLAETLVEDCGCWRGRGEGERP